MSAAHGTSGGPVMAECHLVTVAIGRSRSTGRRRYRVSRRSRGPGPYSRPNGGAVGVAALQLRRMSPGRIPGHPLKRPVPLCVSRHCLPRPVSCVPIAGVSVRPPWVAVRVSRAVSRGLCREPRVASSVVKLALRRDGRYPSLVTLLMAKTLSSRVGCGFRGILWPVTLWPMLGHGFCLADTVAEWPEKNLFRGFFTLARIGPDRAYHGPGLPSAIPCHTGQYSGPTAGLPWARLSAMVCLYY